MCDNTTENLFLINLYIKNKQNENMNKVKSNVQTTTFSPTSDDTMVFVFAGLWLYFSLWGFLFYCIMFLY